MKIKHTAFALSLALGAAAAAAQTSSGSSSPSGSTGSSSSPTTSAASSGADAMTPAQQTAVDNLQQAAARLQDAIREMQDKPEGNQRLGAIRQAQQAFNETNEAMLALPPEIRNAPGMSVSSQTYDDSVRKLMQAADTLRTSIQSMAQLPAGEDRNKAIEQANNALMETHSAIAQAYVPATGSASRTTMGASGDTPMSTPMEAAKPQDGTSGTGSMGSGAAMPADGSAPAAGHDKTK